MRRALLRLCARGAFLDPRSRIIVWKHVRRAAYGEYLVPGLSLYFTATTLGILPSADAPAILCEFRPRVALIAALGRGSRVQQTRAPSPTMPTFNPHTIVSLYNLWWIHRNFGFTSPVERLSSPHKKDMTLQRLRWIYKRNRVMSVFIASRVDTFSKLKTFSPLKKSLELSIRVYQYKRDRVNSIFEVNQDRKLSESN